MLTLPGLSAVRSRGAALAGGALLCAGLGTFYVYAARAHAHGVNVSKARGDQSGYLMDAKYVYHNWHDAHHKVLVGERNRMPVYAGFLALFYKPTMSDPEFFEVGRRANIYLSVVLLLALGLVLRLELAPHPAANLVAVTAFGWFIFKAGYTQAELLFYFLLFVTFLGVWHLFQATTHLGAIGLAAATGAAAAVAHLTKAAMLPFIALFTVTYFAQALFPLDSGSTSRQSARPRVAWRALCLGALILVFLAVLWPYISMNKRVFGRYFYNVNSTFYAWYDDWPEASVGVRLHGDGHHWPSVPASEIPSPTRYWKEHTPAQMARRIESGFVNMALVSYTTYNFLGYLMLYTGVVAFVTATRWRIVASLARGHIWLLLFLVGYLGTYALATAFYFPISGTGTARFFMAHLLPLFFAMSAFLAHDRIAALEWRGAGRQWRVAHFHWLVTLALTVDVAFHVWPRLMTTYGGF